MSHSTWSDVVPFVAHSIFNCDSYSDPANDLEKKIMSPESWLEGEYVNEADFAAQRFPTECEINGWTFIPQRVDRIGKHNRMYACVWEKEGRSIFIINESSYSNVGEFDMCAIANERETLEGFLADFNLTTTIEETDSVQESG